MADTDLSGPSQAAVEQLEALEQSPDRWEPEVDAEIQDIRKRLYPGDGPRSRVVEETAPDGVEGGPDFTTADSTNHYRDTLVAEGHEGVDALFDGWGADAPAKMAAAERYADANPGVLAKAEAMAAAGQMSVAAILELGRRCCAWRRRKAARWPALPRHNPVGQAHRRAATSPSWRSWKPRPTRGRRAPAPASISFARNSFRARSITGTEGLRPW